MVAVRYGMKTLATYLTLSIELSCDMFYNFWGSFCTLSNTYAFVCLHYNLSFYVARISIYL
jgi:hypothetical protein